MSIPTLELRVQRVEAEARRWRLLSISGFTALGLLLLAGAAWQRPGVTGDDRNRERITLVADHGGGAYIRFLDRGTRAKAFLRLEQNDGVYLDFLHWTDTSIRTRRLGFGVDTLLSESR